MSEIPTLTDEYTKIHHAARVETNLRRRIFKIREANYAGRLTDDEADEIIERMQRHFVAIRDVRRQWEKA